VTHAYAKLNLYLDIVGRRADGYHLLETVMQSISLCDEVTVNAEEGDGEISISCDRGDVPTDSRNTAYKAAELFMRETREKLCINIDIKKSIPSGAGMGGGSADAAAALRELNARRGFPLSMDGLLKIAAEVGADVPFCLAGGTKLCRGIGEKLSPLPPVKKYFAVVKPDFSCPTAEAYRKYDSSPVIGRGGIGRFLEKLPNDFAGEMYNVFQVLYADERIGALCRRLKECGAENAILTGSGSAVFGVFGSFDRAKDAAEGLGGFCCRPIV